MKALAPAGSQTAQNVLMSDVPKSGGSRIVRYSGTSSTTAGTNSVISTSAGEDRRVARPQDRQRKARRRGHDDLDEPRAERDDEGVEEVAVDVDPVPGRREVVQVDAVRPQRHRRAQRVLGGGDGGLGEPQQRPQADDEEEHEHQRRGRRAGPADAGAGASRRRTTMPRSSALVAAAGARRDGRDHESCRSTSGSAGSRRPRRRRGTRRASGSARSRPRSRRRCCSGTRTCR